MTKKELKFIWGIIKPYALIETAGLVVAFSTTLLGLLNPYLTKEIIDKALLKRDSSKLVHLICIMILVFIGSKILEALYTYILTYIGENMLYKLRLQVHFISLKNNRVTNEEQIGSITAKILNELPQVVNLISEYAINILKQLLSLAVTLFIIFSLSRLTAIITLFILPFIFIVFKIYNPKIKSVNMKLMNEYSIMNNVLQENLCNKKGIKYHNSYLFAQTKFSDSLLRYIKMKYQYIFLIIKSGYLLETIYFILTVLLFIYGGNKVIDGTLTLGALIALLSYIQRLFSPIKTLSNINYSIQKSLVALRRYLKYIEENNISNDNNKVDIESIKTLELKDVCFEYSKDSKLFWHFNYKFQKGDIIQIIGKNGTGKSTLIDILTRVIEPNKGRVEINGINIKDIKSNSLGKLIGVVSQKPYLFNDNIENNIKLGRNVSSEDMINICEEIKFTDITRDNKINLFSSLSSFGDNLSGGQCKKISILQGLINNPELLILDEPMVNLDEDSKNNLINYIINNKRNRITIIISHEKKYSFVNKVITL